MNLGRTLRVDQRGAGEQLLAQEAERRSHRRLFPMRSALRSVCGTFRSSASDSRRTGNCRVPASPAHTAGAAAPSAAGRLLHHGVQLVLVSQPPAAEKLDVHPHADEPQLLAAHPGADLHVMNQEKGRGVIGLRLDSEARMRGARLLAGLPEVLLPERSVKC